MTNMIFFFLNAYENMHDSEIDEAYIKYYNIKYFYLIFLFNIFIKHF